MEAWNVKSMTSDGQARSSLVSLVTEAWEVKSMTPDLLRGAVCLSRMRQGRGNTLIARLSRQAAIHDIKLLTKCTPVHSNSLYTLFSSRSGFALIV